MFRRGSPAPISQPIDRGARSPRADAHRSSSEAPTISKAAAAAGRGPAASSADRALRDRGRARRGGQVVFSRRPSDVGCEVAVKWSLRRCSAPATIAWPPRDALLANLDHLGIVRVHDLDAHQGRPFLVMESSGGSDLRAASPPSGTRRRSKRKAWSSRSAHAVHGAHAQRITHQDIKPQNILITRLRPRLTTSNPRSHTWATSTANPRGTLAYMGAPSSWPAIRRGSAGAPRFPPRRPRDPLPPAPRRLSSRRRPRFPAKSRTVGSRTRASAERSAAGAAKGGLHEEALAADPRPGPSRRCGVREGSRSEPGSSAGPGRNGGGFRGRSPVRLGSFADCLRSGRRSLPSLSTLRQRLLPSSRRRRTKRSQGRVRRRHRGDEGQSMADAAAYFRHSESTNPTIRRSPLGHTFGKLAARVAGHPGRDSDHTSNEQIFRADRPFQALTLNSAGRMSEDFCSSPPQRHLPRPGRPGERATSSL